MINWLLPSIEPLHDNMNSNCVKGKCSQILVQDCICQYWLWQSCVTVYGQLMWKKTWCRMLAKWVIWMHYSDVLWQANLSKQQYQTYT